MNRLRPVAKWMLGGLFCLSALLKLRSIDSFELYLFSFGVVSFDGCSLLARLLIGAEAMLGAMFLTGWHHRLLCRLYAAVLAGFSLCSRPARRVTATASARRSCSTLRRRS